MSIKHKHSPQIHTVTGPAAALPLLLSDERQSSLLDVGCGTGTWLKAAIEFGIFDVYGVDGVEIPPNELHIPIEKIQQLDLTRPWNLHKRFDVALCLEVAEHLNGTSAPILIDALIKHADRIYFSAACPGQSGQHHVNCQWPAYWQKLFNDRGYVCSDSARWRIWEDTRIEAWYRQNMFVARRDAAAAGHEPRIKEIVHPEMLSLVLPETERFESHVKRIEDGHMELMWYLKTPMFAFSKKFKRKLR